MSKETVRVPDIGGVDAAEVVEVLVAVGDAVERDQGLVVLESDKASLEIPSTVAGTVVELLAGEGAQLAEGDPVAVIETGGEDGGEAPAAEPAQEPGEEPREEPAAAAAAAPDADGEASSAAGAPQGSAAGEAGGGEATSTTVSVPDIGTDDAVDVVEVSISVGASISEGDTLIVLESDKASMEVPATLAGTVTEVLVTEGQQVRQGDPIARVAGAAAAAEAAPAQPPAEATPQRPAASASPPGADSRGAAKPVAPPPEAPPAAAGSTPQTYAGPAVRRLAREFGVPLEKVSGSGPKGRVRCPRWISHSSVPSRSSRAARSTA